jgi:predicted ATP-grasp superfamily ATP-dependent carboligase
VMDEQSKMYELEFPAPQLSSADGQGPVLIHGLEGFSDAGHAVKLATTHLRESLESELVASFAVDELVDYRSRRPTMTFKSDHFSDYDQPELNLYALKDTAGTPFLLLAGMEPDLRWERFTTAVRLLAEQLGVRRTVGINAIPMAIPHTRPLGVTAHSTNKELIKDHQRWAGELQVPGSASSLIELRMAQHGHESIGFSVHVPHYLAQTDYPGAAETLLENVSEVTDLQLPLNALGEAAARVKEQVDEHIAGNEEVQTVVHALERQYDAYVTAQEQQSSLLASEEDLPSGDELGAEFERFLAEQAQQDGHGERSDGDSGTAGGA